MIGREIYKGKEIAKCQLGGIIFVVMHNGDEYWFNTSDEAKAFIDGN